MGPYGPLWALGPESLGTCTLLTAQWNDQWKRVGTQVSTLTDIVEESRRVLAVLKRNVSEHQNSPTSTV